MIEKPQKTAIPPAPRWLTRAEKLAFRHLCDQRNAANRPVSDAEVDALCDLVSLRSRIADTRKMYRYVIRRLQENPAWQTDQAYALATSRMIDAQTARAQKMAAELGLRAEG